MSDKGPIDKPKECVDYGAGEVIFAEGSAGKDIYIIVDGSVEVSQRIGWENETIAILEKGDFFGEMGPITDTPRSATTTAIEDTSLQRLSLEELLWDMHNNQKIMGDVFSRMVKRLRDTTSLLNIEITKKLPTELDSRVPKVSYLRKKVKEQDAEIENLRKQVSLSRIYRSTPWSLSLRAIELAMLLIILILVILKY